jgi:hypothetical protein
LVHSSGVKSSRLAMAVSSERSVLAAAEKRYTEGGDECLFDRPLCVRDANRTAIVEKKAQTLVDRRDQIDLMRVFPCSIQTNGTNRTTRDHIRNRKSMPCGLPPMD